MDVETQTYTQSASATFCNYFFRNKVLKNSTLILVRPAGEGVREGVQWTQRSFSWKWGSEKLNQKDGDITGFQCPPPPPPLPSVATGLKWKLQKIFQSNEKMQQN